jgi:DnaJ-class molecular chaperone
VGRGSGQSHPIFKAQYPSVNESYRVANLVVPVHCSLTELYNGCTKELTYDKKVLTKDGKNAEFVKETKTIIINPGFSNKTPLVFPGQGHSEPGYQQSMLIFNLIEVNEKNFRREGDDLIYTEQISLMEALDAKSITVVLVW